jgi:hypothetical protein
MRAATSRGLAGLAALAVAACAGLPAARMALPEPLAAQPAETLRGLGGGRGGDFVLGRDTGRFERGADRLSLFDDRFVADRATAGWQAADGTRARCRGRQASASGGVLAAAVKRYTVQCEISGPQPAELQLQADGAALSPATRSGTITAGGQRLLLRSVHRVQGSPLPLDTPIGYVFEHEGRAVGAVELNGTEPRVWRPAPGTPLHGAVTHAVLALALLRDPAN